MARPLRIEYPGAIYHLLSRGDRREAIVEDDLDRLLFFDLLGRTCERTGWQVHAVILMSNHFHLVVETPRANLSVGMHWLLARYTQRFNQRHGVCGHLFAGRYKALLVDGREGSYLRRVCDYVHLNPARAEILRSEAPLESYPWSSYPGYLKEAKKRPGWLRTERVFAEHGLATDQACERSEFSRRMEAMRSGANRPDRELNLIRRGWKLGAEDFLDWVLERVDLQAQEEHPSLERDETEQGKAMRIIGDELKGLGWSAAELQRRAKNDPSKVALARRLRAETAVTLKWIGQALQMGVSSNVANRLNDRRKSDIENSRT